jgi:hypothetical protein
MIVDLTLAALALATLVVVLAAPVWAFTRPADRLQLAAACLLGCSVLYFAAAAQAYETNKPLALAAGAYTLLVYVVLAAFALFQQRWAWQAAIAAFGLHLLLSAGMIAAWASLGRAAWPALVLWLVLGGFGLHGALHPGSRRAMGTIGASHA